MLIDSGDSVVLFRADEYGLQVVYMNSANDSAEVNISSGDGRYWLYPIIYSTPATAIFIYKTPDKIDVVTHRVDSSNISGNYESFPPNEELILYGSESSGVTFADITSFIVKKT